jgi:Tfp pilus assembly protein PilF
MPFVTGAAPRDPAPSYAETFYPKWHYGWSELKAVRVGDWKYIDAPKPELYDLRSDRSETRNAIDARGPLAAGLSAEIAKLQSGFGAAATADAPQPDPDTLARLRSLGYVGIAAPGSSGRGADPKDMVPKIEVFKNGISRAIDALGRGNADAAIAELTKLVEINDRSYELHLFLGDAYSDKRQWDRALGEYAAARVLNGHSSAPYVSEARVHLAMHNLSAANAAIDAATRLEPTGGEVALVRGLILDAEGRPEDAIAQYEGTAMDLRRYDLAKTQFEALLAMGYRPSRMHFGLGQVAEAGGDKKTAAAEYRLALRLEPEFGPARAALSRLGQ